MTKSKLNLIKLLGLQILLNFKFNVNYTTIIFQASSLMKYNKKINSTFRAVNGMKIGNLLIL